MSNKSTLIHRLARLVGQAIMLAALYFLALRLAQNWAQVSAALTQMLPLPLAGAAALTLFMLLLMSLGWVYALEAVGVSLGWRAGFSIYYWASIYRYLPGAIWHLPGRAYLIRQRGISLTTFAHSTFLELFFMLSIGGILATWGLASYLKRPLLLALSALIGISILLLIGWPKLLSVFHLEAKRRCLILMVVVYTLVWFSYGGAVTLTLHALSEVRVPGLLSMVTINSAAWAAGFLSLAPVGLGVRELSLSTLLGPGLGTAAILASLTQRVMEVSLEALLWAIARWWIKDQPA